MFLMLILISVLMVALLIYLFLPIFLFFLRLLIVLRGLELDIYVLNLISKNQAFIARLTLHPRRLRAIFNLFYT